MVCGCSERNGIKPAGDWVGANAIVCVPGANVRATAGFLAEKVDTKKEAIAGYDRWAEQKFITMKNANAMTFLEVVTGWENLS